MTTRFARLAALGLAVVSLFAGPARAQSASASAAASRWEAWLGCWRPVQQSTGLVDHKGMMRCVLPTPNPAVVHVVTIDSGRVTARDTVDASGAEQKFDAQGCAGAESARFSTDQNRVFLHSDATCSNNTKRVANGIVAIAPNGEWLDIQTVTAGTNTMAAAMHYRDGHVTRADVPAELANAVEAIAARAMAINTARTAAASMLDVATIAEAVQRVDTMAVQAWLVERGTRFDLDAKKLTMLADAGVPGSVTDVMIGASYPDHFQLQRGATTRGGAFSSTDSARLAERYLRDRCGPMAMSISVVPSVYDACRYAYGYRGYSRYLYDDYLFGYGYSPYAYRGYYGYYGPVYYGQVFYSGPIVSVRPGSGDDHGHVERGRGYVRGSSDTPSRGSGASSSVGSDGSGGGSGGGGGGGSSASSGSSSSGGGRTAIPKPPA